MRSTLSLGRIERPSFGTVAAFVVLAILLFVAKAALVAWIAMLILGAFGVLVGYWPVFGITIGGLWLLGLVTS